MVISPAVIESEEVIRQAVPAKMGFSDVAAVMHEHYAGHAFERTSGVDAHNGHLRFAWALVGPDGAVAVSGVDVADLAADGRLARVVGFFGDLPAR